MLVSASRKSEERVPKGARTRDSILRVAVNLASVDGLEGVTIGRLADELKMSKSGLFAHFGSKEDLQLATVEMARTIFVDHVIRPALTVPVGAPRLWALCDAWVRYVEHPVFPGGCFFTAASFEFDSRPGPVRDRIAAVMKAWMEVLRRAVDEAKKAKHLRPTVDSDQFAFEIKSLAMGAHAGFQLADKDAMNKARSIILERIRSLATPSCPAISTQLRQENRSSRGNAGSPARIRSK
jgi:AcrR family transcriptional regulator